jgi:hypothetical protein
MAAAILSVFILAGCPNDGGTETDPSITGLVITGGTEAVKGTSVQLTAEFTWDQDKANTPATGVTWSITGQSSNNTSIGSTSGILNVDSSEATDDTITVQAQGGGYSNTKDITVKEPLAGQEPTVTSIDVTGQGSITKGSTDILVQYSATVNGNNNPSQNVSWSVDGSPTGVSIDTNGKLTVTKNASAGKINVRATSTLIGFTDKSGYKEVDITSTASEESETTAIDFTTKANAGKLGLYPEVNYDSGDDLIDAMDLRATNAKVDPDGTGPNIPFYNPVLQVPDAFDYGTDQLYDQVANTEPAMAWFIHNNKLVVYGHRTHPTSVAEIVFNVAVINTSTGQGWITGDANNPHFGITYKRQYVDGESAGEISIKALTGNNFTTTAELTGHKIYIIVRALPTDFPEDDFNAEIDSYRIKNVIDITPTSS